jgi:hypothetical protein
VPGAVELFDGYLVTTAREPQPCWSSPAGPDGGCAYEVGKELAEYKALREVELWADRTLGSRRVR